MAMRMAVPRSWFSIVRKKFLARTTKFGPHSKNIIIIHNNTSITSNEEDNRTSCVDHTKDGNIVISSSSPGRDGDEIRTTGVTATTTEEDVDSTTDDSKKEIKTSSGVDSTEEEEESIDQEELGPSKEKINAAAIRIQSVFRGHLARRALRALRSLVKLQAVARGMHIRRQVTTALNCMHALVRLQLRVRARKLLNGSSNNHF